MMKGYKYFTMKRISLFLLVLMLCCVFVGCNAKKFIINYDLDGGDCNGLVIEYLEGTEVKLPTPVKDGYIFIGWYDGDTKVNIKYVVSKNVTLKARWTEIKSENNKDNSDNKEESKKPDNPKVENTKTESKIESSEVISSENISKENTKTTETIKPDETSKKDNVILHYWRSSLLSNSYKNM